MVTKLQILNAAATLEGHVAALHELTTEKERLTVIQAGKEENKNALLLSFGELPAEEIGAAGERMAQINGELDVVSSMLSSVGRRIGPAEKQVEAMNDSLQQLLIPYARDQGRFREETRFNDLRDLMERWFQDYSSAPEEIRIMGNPRLKREAQEAIKTLMLSTSQNNHLGPGAMVEVRFYTEARNATTGAEQGQFWVRFAREVAEWGLDEFAGAALPTEEDGAATDAELEFSIAGEAAQLLKA